MPKILHNVREGILIAGRDLLTKSGYQEFSVRTVAKRCGIGVGTLYNYYPSKQDLISAILIAEWDIYLRRMAQAAKTAASPQEKLENIFGELCGFVQGVHNIWVGDIADSAEYADIHNAQRQRSMVRMQLADVVTASLKMDNGSEPEAWLVDCVTRLFLAYAGVAGAEETVGNAIKKLLS